MNQNTSILTSILALFPSQTNVLTAHPLTMVILELANICAISPFILSVISAGLQSLHAGNYANYELYLEIKCFGTPVHLLVY